MVARKSHADHSDEKRTTEFVGEIQVMNDNDQQVNQVHRQGQESVWVSYQAASAWRDSLFLS